MKFQVIFGHKRYYLTAEQKTQWDKVTGSIVKQTQQKLELIINWKMLDSGVYDPRLTLKGGNFIND